MPAVFSLVENLNKPSEPGPSLIPQITISGVEVIVTISSLEINKTKYL